MAGDDRVLPAAPGIGDGCSGPRNENEELRTHHCWSGLEESDRREASAAGRRRFWTELGLVAMVTIWGVNFSVVKWALAVIEPLGFNALRHVLASAFMLGVLAVRGGVGAPSRRDLGLIVLLGLVGNVAYQMAFIFGLNRTRAGNASLMLALVPIFLLVFGGRGAETRGVAWLGAGLSVLGVALVSGSALQLEGTATLVGDLMMIGAAAMWAAYTLGARPLIERYGPIRTTAWTLWAGSIGLFLAGIPSLLRQDWSAVGIAAWGGVIYSSLLSIGLAYLLWYRGVQQLGGARTAIFSNLTPVVALAAGALWLGERLTIYAIFGAALVLGGIFLVRRGDRQVWTSGSRIQRGRGR
ncbi:MAG TPA: DMT family transporter [Candidatus Limnocylindrales bacterium]|nr:DMT family transporter [Candidatus Limnocylindrales bacterium]